MSALDNAKKHYAAITGDSQLELVKVPEWDADIYFKPMQNMNVKTLSGLIEAVNKGTLEGMVEALIIRALDQDGKPLFKKVNTTEFLFSVAPAVITKVITAMGRHDSLVGVEEAAGN